MPWLDAVPQFVLAVALLFIPGLIIALAARLRGLQILAVAPAISVSIVAVSAIAAPIVGVGWSLLPVTVLTVLVAAVAFAVSFLLSRRRRGDSPAETRPSRAYWGVVLGQVGAVLLAVVLIGRRIISALGQPESFSQTFDNVFHLNAVRYILDTGSGSSLTLNSMTGAGSYPAAWHDLVSLVAGITGANIPVSVNVTNIVVAAVVWPLGCIYLGQTVLGPRIAVSFSAAVLSAGFGAFPISLLDFGVLYPNFLAVALLPSVIAVGLDCLRLSAKETNFRLIAVLLLFAVLPGLALAHPSAAMAWIALMLPPAIYVWGRAISRTIKFRSGRGQVVAAVVLLATFVVGAGAIRGLWETVRPPAEAAFWPPLETTGQAIGQVISSAAIGRPVAWAIMVLTLLGIYLTIRSSRQLWLLGFYAMGAFLYVVVSSFPAEEFRTFVTGIWYNDPPRLAALLPLVTIPLACRGAVWVWDLLPQYFLAGRRFLKTRLEVPATKRSLTTITLIVGTVMVLVLTAATQRGNVRQAQDSMASSYRLSEDSALISTDEMALLDRLPSQVPENAMMVGNPWNGSSLAYAFADRKLIQLHILSAVPEGTAPLLNGPTPSPDDPNVCSAVERLNIDYLLDFGHREVHGRDSGYKGLDNLIASGMAALEDSEGEAKLYRMQLCGM